MRKRESLPGERLVAPQYKKGDLVKYVGKNGAVYAPQKDKHYKVESVYVGESGKQTLRVYLVDGGDQSIFEVSESDVVREMVH